MANGGNARSDISLSRISQLSPSAELRSASPRNNAETSLSPAVFSIKDATLYRFVGASSYRCVRLVFCRRRSRSRCGRGKRVVKPQKLIRIGGARRASSEKRVRGTRRLGTFSNGFHSSPCRSLEHRLRMPRQKSRRSDTFQRACAALAVSRRVDHLRRFSSPRFALG